jgi:hypothetical protein
VASGFFSGKGGRLCVDDRERESLWSTEEGRPNGQGGCGGLLNVFFQKTGRGLRLRKKILRFRFRFFLLFSPTFLKISDCKINALKVERV